MRITEYRGWKVADLWEKHKEVMEQYGISYEDLVGSQVGQRGLGSRVAIMVQSARITLRKYWNEIKEAGA